MLLKVGDKLHVLIRRKFEKDIRRHMIGMVENASENAVVVLGRKAVYNGTKANYIIINDLSSQVVSLTDNGNIITVLPDDVNLDDLHYKVSPGKTLLTDGKNYTLRINDAGMNS
ncbi:MAG: hypothetical protein JXR78_01135 [Victivallales bacterium]|nr:hypothetical protein [Victivallales bacterium]